MSTFVIRTEELSKVLKKEGAKIARCVQIALKIAAERWRKYLVNRVDDLGIADTGGYQEGFQVSVLGGRVVVRNTHPAAGVIELGAAPHPVSIEGQEMIRGWCVRKLGLSEKEARNAAFLICRKIREFGQEPKYVVRDSLPQLLKYFEIELGSALRSEYAK